MWFRIGCFSVFAAPFSIFFLFQESKTLIFWKFLKNFIKSHENLLTQALFCGIIQSPLRMYRMRFYQTSDMREVRKTNRTNAKRRGPRTIVHLLCFFASVFKLQTEAFFSLKLLQEVPKCASKSLSPAQNASKETMTQPKTKRTILTDLKCRNTASSAASTRFTRKPSN